MKAAAALVLLSCLAGCPAPPEDAPAVEETPAEGWPSPGLDDGDRPCADVADVRACWGGGGADDRGCRAGVCLVTRPVPVFPAQLGWRCHGSGPERRCTDRIGGAGSFACDGDHCVQAHPRMPDQGRWECVERAGAVACRGGAEAAGVLPAAADPGWICGARRGRESERICVDLSPDVPTGFPDPWRCSYEHDPVERRLCERGAALAVLGAICDAERSCVDGSTCAGGRCLPSRPAPDCWLDDDCRQPAACRFGTCVREAQ